MGRCLKQIAGRTSATGLREINDDVPTMPIVYPTLLIVNEHLIGGIDLPKLFLGLKLALRWGSVGVCLERALLVRSTDCKW